jgi:hypothetical protein
MISIFFYITKEIDRKTIYKQSRKIYTMRTRSITRSEEEGRTARLPSTDSSQSSPNPVTLVTELEVNIDFDEASAAWRANKKSTRNGCYKYVCEYENKNNIKCRNNPVFGVNFCSRHNI